MVRFFCFGISNHLWGKWEGYKRMTWPVHMIGGSIDSHLGKDISLKRRQWQLSK